MIEQLTKDERSWLTCLLAVTGPKALRIIDAQAEALAKVRALISGRASDDSVVTVRALRAALATTAPAELDTSLMTPAGRDRWESAKPATAPVFSSYIEQVVSLERDLAAAHAREAEWKAERRKFCDELHRTSIQLTAANARANAREESLIEHKQAISDAATERDQLKTELQDSAQALALARGEAATEKARVAELEAEQREDAVHRHNAVSCVKAAEARLADATALLGRAWDEWGSNTDEDDDPVTQELARELAAFVDGQPAAPTRAEAEPAFMVCPGCGHPRRTGADQAVLDAMGEIAEHRIRGEFAYPPGPLAKPCRAELARRGLK